MLEHSGSSFFLLLKSNTVTEYPSSLTHGNIKSVAMCGQGMSITERSVALIAKTPISFMCQLYFKLLILD